MVEQDTYGLLKSERERNSAIVRVSVIGIVTNVTLAAFKAGVGILSNSIAIILDAVNNLSDAASSIITIIGTRVASKQPDHSHPYGHGRAEYLSSIIVSAIVLWAGLTSLMESINGIIHPETPSYETVTLIVVAVAVLVKIVLGNYVKGQGKRLDSGTLVASGQDASMDALISASTLLAAILYLTTGICLEAWLASGISLIIIKSGVEMLQEALSKILGERVDSELALHVKQVMSEVDGVRGAYDLILNDYGPQRLQGSVHIEVDETLTARDIDKITRQLQLAVMRETGVIIHTVGIYSCNSNCEGDTAKIEAALKELVEKDAGVLQYHGLYVDSASHRVNFDLVISFDVDRKETFSHALETMQERFPDYRFIAVLDSDISD